MKLPTNSIGSRSYITPLFSKNILDGLILSHIDLSSMRKRGPNRGKLVSRLPSRRNHEEIDNLVSICDEIGGGMRTNPDGSVSCIVYPAETMNRFVIGPEKYACCTTFHPQTQSYSGCYSIEGGDCMQLHHYPIPPSTPGID